MIIVYCIRMAGTSVKSPRTITQPIEMSRMSTWGSRSRKWASVNKNSSPNFMIAAK